MGENSHNKQIVGILIISGILTLGAFGVFIFTFSGQEISKDINDWGAFGGYISGVISLISLGLLAYLTYILAVNDIKENKNLQFKIKRNEAYIQLTQNNQSINRFLNAINLIYPYAPRFGTKPVDEIININYSKALDNFNEEFRSLNNMLYEIDSFEIQYGHLFNYDFESTEHKELIQLATNTLKLAREIFSAIQLIGLSFEDNRDAIKKLSELFEDNIKEKLNSLYHKYSDFLNKLREELV